MMTGRPSLFTVDLTKSYESQLVLHSLTIDVIAGEVTSLVGRSGSGKSTLLNILSGLDLATSGTVHREGRVGYVTQHDSLLPWRTVLENVLLPAELSGYVTEHHRILARQYLSDLGLAEVEDSLPAALSGGMKQKVALARLFVQAPNICLFDEPFANIDFGARLSLTRYLRTWLKDGSRIGLFVSHAIEDAVAVADSVIVLGANPSTISFRSAITIKEELRDPLMVRTTPQFQEIFSSIYRAMSGVQLKEAYAQQ